MGSALAALLGLTITGCSGPQNDAGTPLTAADIASARIHRLVERADAGQRATAEVSTWVRYNPADCDCPTWEARLFGRWERVALTPSREAGAYVAQVLTADEWPTALRLWARLRPESDVQRDQWGWGYATVSVVELRDDTEELSTVGQP